MPPILHRDSYEGREALVIDRPFLLEVVSVASDAGWTLSHLDLTLKGTRELKAEVLDDLSSVAPHLLESVTRVTMVFRLKSEYAFVQFQDYGSPYIDKGVSFHMSTVNEGAMLTLKRGLVTLFEQRKQWYSSARLPWDRLITLMQWLSTAGLVYILIGFYKPRLPYIHYQWLTPFYVFAGVYYLFLNTRGHLFPVVEFNLTDPPAEETRSARVRKRAWVTLCWIAGPLLGGVIALIVKHH